MSDATGRELQVVAPRGVARSFDADALAADWRAHLAELVAAGEMAQATAHTYARGMDKLLDWIGAQDATRVGPQAIRAWKADMLERGLSASTANVHLAGARCFFAWAVAERGLAYDPTNGVKSAARRGVSRRHKRDALTDAEVLRVLARPDASTAQGQRDRAMLHLMAYCGLRGIEVQRAQLGDLASNGHLRLNVRGKGGGGDTTEPVYIVNADALAALHDWLAVHPRRRDPLAPLFCGLGNRNAGGALTMATIRRLVTGYYAEAGVVGLRKSTHSLRHSLVTNLIRHKVAPTAIMAVTRHKSLDTLAGYAHEMERDANPAEALVDYGQ